jgi:hypothetical protein
LFQTAKVQSQQGLGRDGDLSIGSTLVIAEVDLEHPVVELLDDGPHLTPNQAVLAVVDQQSDHVSNVEG